MTDFDSWNNPPSWYQYRNSMNQMVFCPTEDIYVEDIIAHINHTPAHFGQLIVKKGDELMRESHVKDREVIITHIASVITIGQRITIETDSSVTIEIIFGKGGSIKKQDSRISGMVKRIEAQP